MTQRTLLFINGLVAALLLASCGGGAPKTAAAPEASDEFNLDEALAREFDPLPQVPVAHPNQSWQAMVEGRTDPQYQQGENFHGFAIDIGTSQPLMCFVFDSKIDPATSAAAYMQTSDVPLQIKRVDTAVHVVNGNPAFLAYGLYLVEQEDTKIAGLVKIATAVYAQNAALCLHDEFGYMETFERIALQFFADLTFAEAPPAPDFNEIHVIGVQGSPVGFMQQQRRCKDDKTCMSYNQSSMLLVADGGAMLPIETLSMATTDKSDIITELVTVGGHGNEVHTQLKLTHDKGNRYSYTGTKDGLEIEGTLQSQATKGLIGDRSWRRQLAQLVAAKQETTVPYESFQPAGDGSGTPDITVINYQLRFTDDGPVLEETGPDSTTASLLDEHGYDQATHITLKNGLIFQTTRVHLSGAQP
ncbi:MAG: hypothetical protein GX146_01050 [Myxococcales bacterium]|jgi:hypothetical protein|nr:hypothetical protein [Myxococcales bacterium]